MLLLVVNHATGPTILFTERTAHLAAHAGQVSFPGGSSDEGDSSPERTALREAEEEIGLARAAVTVLEELPRVETRSTGYRIAPLVALVKPDFALQLNPAEVDYVFEVPLAFLMDPANHQRHSREWRGRERSFYAIPYGERYIWGATAGMIKTLHLRLFA